MNKYLLIILSLLSIVIYGTDENIENQIGEKLKIDVKFTLPKEIIKYVVYASEDDGITKQDTLNLPDFIMSQNPSRAGFVEAPPKVYVKRVINENIEELQPTEKVVYKLTHLDGFMGDSIALTDTIAEGSTSYRQITSYLPKTTIEDIITNSGINGYSITNSGNIAKTGTSPLQLYFPAAQINLKNNNGVLETTSPENKYSYPIPEDDIKKIEAYIYGGKSLGNVSLKVIVN